MPREPIPPLVPDLAVEVRSQSNTPQEMQQKLRDYFKAGVRLVWSIDPQTRSARSHTSAADATTVAADEQPDGGAGSRLHLERLFDEADRQRP